MMTPEELSDCVTAIRTLAADNDQWAQPSRRANIRYQIAVRNAGVKTHAERIGFLNLLFPEFTNEGVPAASSLDFSAGQIKALTLWLENDEDRARRFVETIREALKP